MNVLHASQVLEVEKCDFHFISNPNYICLLGKQLCNENKLHAFMLDLCCFQEIFLKSSYKLVIKKLMAEQNLL